MNWSVKNIGSLSYVDLANVDPFHYRLSRNLLVSPQIAKGNLSSIGKLSVTRQIEFHHDGNAACSFP